MPVSDQRDVLGTFGLVVGIAEGMITIGKAVAPSVKRVAKQFDDWFTVSVKDYVGAAPDPDDCDMFRTGGSGTLEPATCDIWRGPGTLTVTGTPLPLLVASGRDCDQFRMVQAIG